MAKKIILLSDGTGNSAGKVWRTNVWRVFQALELKGSNQIAIYDDGVGTSSFKPLAILGGVFGYGLKRNVLNLYKFLCRNYQTGDKIYGFGFRRGAFTMRIVMGLVLNQGLVKFANEAELDQKAHAAYRAYRHDKYPAWNLQYPFRLARFWLDKLFYTSCERPVDAIEFVGVWDTVAAYGLPIDEMTRGVSEWIWPREMPNKLPPLEYPDRFEVRYVSANGGIRWKKHAWVNVSSVCIGEYVGLEEIDDGLWDVYFGPLKLGRLHERHMRIEDAYGRLRRHSARRTTGD
jgi:hypothetical protein